MSDLELDDAQRDAVEIEPGERQVVIAGPGSGKTEVVSRLIERLVEEEGVDATDGILVISFSNAAVFAADRRLRAHGVGPVTVQTMDSLAGEIVHDLGDEDVAGLGFDRRISLATRLLAGEEWDRLEDLEHLVVDEVQDVVGVRADFLMELLRRLPAEAGFTLLGDPAQGIYDWQLQADDRAASRTTSTQLLAWASAMDGVRHKELTGQYRAVSRDARKVVELRGSVLGTAGRSPLEEMFAGLVSVASVADVVEHARSWSGTTAFLTGTNGQALLVADAIADAGAAVEVRRSAQQPVLASWIARLVADHPTAGITLDELQGRAAEIVPEADPAVLWRALRSVAGGRGREVDIAGLARELKRPRPLAPDLIEPTHAHLIASTVHRAKGLEFDHVVYVDFPHKPWIDESADIDGGELRTLFVALSRARETLARAEGPDDRGLRSFVSRGDGRRRWYLGGRAPWMTLGFELRVDDLDRTAPPGEGQAGQDYIAESVHAGDPLDLVIDLSRSTVHLPVWELLHRGRTVGRTSEAFGESFVARVRSLEKKKRGWPGLSGARVESVATVSGDRQASGVGRHGLWLSPVCAGMLRIDWNGESDG
ncbi:MAG: UvrD-helicase domain-containing protein [Cellulomonas sp.]